MITKTEIIEVPTVSDKTQKERDELKLEIQKIIIMRYDLFRHDLLKIAEEYRLDWYVETAMGSWDEQDSAIKIYFRSRQ